MDLEHYIKSLPSADAKREFAEKIGTSYDYLRHLTRGFRRVNEGMAIKIEIASNGAVRCEESCPDADWHRIRAREVAPPLRKVVE